MSAPALLEYLRRRDVRLRIVEDRLLVDAPASVVDEELRRTLSKHKDYLLRQLEEANERGLIIQWSKQPG